MKYRTLAENDVRDENKIDNQETADKKFKEQNLFILGKAMYILIYDFCCKDINIFLNHMYAVQNFAHIKVNYVFQELS